MSSPTYLVNLVNGRIVVTPASGADATEEEVDWIKRLITISLRSRNFVNAKTGVGTHVEEDGTVEGYRFPVHPIVTALSERQNQLGVTNGLIAQMLKVHTTTLPNYKYGKSRPHLETLDVWAWLVGLKLMLVPASLFEYIKKLVALPEEERNKLLESDDTR